MRKVAILVAAAAAFASVPASAQVGVGAGGGVDVGAGVSVDPGRTVGSAVDTVDRTVTPAVDSVDRTADRALDSTEFALVTRNQVAVGAEVRDSRGRRIGTVSRIDGNAAVVVRGRNAYHVPLSALYRRTSGTARGLVTSIPRAQLTGHANAQASADAAAQTGR